MKTTVEILVTPGTRWKNKKNQNVYIVEELLPDYTNAREGQVVVLYHYEVNNAIRGVREHSEFLIKFEELKED